MGGASVLVVLLIQSLFSIYLTAKYVWKDGDVPLSKTKLLLTYLQSIAQILFGFFVVFVISLLISNKAINSEAGLPVMSAFVAYVLGKGLKDVSTEPDKKK